MSEERLRRQLRAQAVVNRQLHAQLAEVTAQLRAVQGHDASAVRVLWRGLEAVLPNRVASKVERRLRGALGTPPRPRAVGSSEGPVGEWLDDLVAAPSAASVSFARVDEDRSEQGEPLRVADIGRVGPTVPRPPQAASLLGRARARWLG